MSRPGPELTVFEEWWLDHSALPDRLWARLRVFTDGTAEVFDLDGVYHRFDGRCDAELFLCEDEYVRASYLEPDDLAELGLRPDALTPPSAPDDVSLVPLMLVHIG